MRINRISGVPGVSDVGDDYVTYEVLDPETQSGVYYIALNKETNLVNVYPLGAEGEVNRVDSTLLRYRTELPVTVNKDGVLVYDASKDLARLLVDLLGEHAAILVKDLGLKTDDVVDAAMGMSLTPEEDDAVDLTKYGGDPYEGLEPKVIDILKDLSGATGGVAPGAPETAEPAPGEGEEPPPGEEEEELPEAP